MKEYVVRDIKKADYINNYLELLSQDFTIEPSKISFFEFCNYVDTLNENHKIYVICDVNNNEVIGSVTILIETKLIHNLGKVAHIEDVIIDNRNRRKGFGKLLINKCLEYAKKQKCYKIILNCSDKNISFYEKCGFTKKENEMALYL